MENISESSYKEFIQTLKDDGFVKIGSILNSDENDILSRECFELFKSQNRVPWKGYESFNYEYRMPIIEDENWAVLSNFIGINSKIDQLMEKILSDKKLKTIMKSCIGDDYKLWVGNIRLSKSSDKGLGFHTDGVGEMGISILLDDAEDESGTTSFLPKSHKWPLSSQESGLDSIPRTLFSPFASSARGKKGDVFIFFKKTYHGRMPNRAANKSFSIILAPVASGYSFIPFKIDKMIIMKLGPELKRLMSMDNLIRIDGSPEYQIHSNSMGGRYIDMLYDNKISFLSPWKLLLIFKVVTSLVKKILSSFKPKV
tara:strand:+ start:844 stop:1782 length:939 start_codon:yes stop_codon:yes gene_type:complete